MSGQVETVLPAPPLEAEQRVILKGISWETYERLLSEHEESSGTHFIYDQGMLEIMILSLKHEKLKHVLALLVELLAAELGIDIEGAGSTTFRREDLARGFEPDASFYLENVEYIRQKDEIDLTNDPPPDLVIEVDLSSLSLDKFPIFAAVGVGEIWHYAGERVAIFVLADGNYVERAESRALPTVTGEALTHFVETGQTLKRTVWLRQVREWVRTYK
jgi:Uma2 family endonuclease